MNLALCQNSQVKDLAATKYNYTFGKGEVVSTFVAAFYDAVLLYALALNDTLREAENPGGPLDGAAVIRKMWNRTFQGIFYDIVILYCSQNSNTKNICTKERLTQFPNQHLVQIFHNYCVGNSVLVSDFYKVFLKYR